ncbi:MAG: 4-oxalocrotonate tautomerase [Candidatus Omnitrophica bacterium CG11_big_fil_rev_8_21_14_0_20_64_10]|nr:MAG: 4-oxalocrotonate tautomerase [Candidatus Omnitrophica bacterium CG11_big_fil_rev_8_21_14_0_20_64_10]
MPVISVELFEGRSRAQKKAFVEAVTRAAEEILKTPREHVWITFTDRPKSDWGIGGKLCDEPAG